MAKRKNKTSIALPAALIARLDRLAKSAGTTRSEMIREMVEAGIDQTEMIVKATSDPVLLKAVGKVLTDPGVFRQMVHGLRSELSDQQLELFQARLGAAQAITSPPPGRKKK